MCGNDWFVNSREESGGVRFLSVATQAIDFHLRADMPFTHPVHLESCSLILGGKKILNRRCTVCVSNQRGHCAFLPQP